MLSVGVTVRSAMGDTVTGIFLSAFYVFSKPGSAASAAKHDETSMIKNDGKEPQPRFFFVLEPLKQPKMMSFLP
jgi:hypothetical protein